MKDKTPQYRGVTRRHKTKAKHKDRVDTERRLFTERLKQRDRRNVLEFWIKTDEDKPTDYFIVEFNLKDKILLSEFKESLETMLGGLIEENKMD
jgi:hypothetical protein